MDKRVLFFLLAVGLVAVAIMVIKLPVAQQGSDALVIGRVEKVGLDDAHMVAKARIDTGAGMASINAEILEIKKATAAGEADRVVFQMKDENDQMITLTRDIVEWQNIKKKGAGGFMKRPVVRMDFCLAGKKIEGRVNLADRSDFIYPVLIGRNILKAGKFLIDPNEKFMQEPGCD